MNLNYQFPSFTILFVLPVIFAGCCHQDIKESSRPITNNLEIMGCEEEWEPEPDEAWWKLCVYETLKTLSDEYNKND